MSKIHPEIIKTALDAHKAYSDLVEQISQRLDYIIKFCLKTCNGKLDWWEWQEWQDDFCNSYNPDTINLNVHWTYENKMVFIDKNGEEQNLEWGEFPTRWLYEDFEDEFTNGLKLRIEKVNEKAKKATEKRQKKKQEQEKLLAAAKAKLTPEELKALKNA